jgi:hypothetical protein
MDTIIRRKMRMPAAFMLPLTLLVGAAAQEQAIIVNRPSLQDRGHVEGSIYRNDGLGMTYQLPDGFSVNNLPDNLPGGTLLLMIADRQYGTPEGKRLVLFADDDRQYTPWTVKEYVAHFVHNQPAKFHPEVLREPYRLEISGQEFFRADYKSTENGYVGYSTFICTRRKRMFVAWTFVTLSRETTEEVAKSVKSVTFR